jgi:hypothetical protein
MIYQSDQEIFAAQEDHLSGLPLELFEQVRLLFDLIKDEKEPVQSEIFKRFESFLYEVKLIFNFRWKEWEEGNRIIHDANADLSCCSLLDLSMYLTLIFRLEHQQPGTISTAYNNGVLRKIVYALAG